MPTSRGLDRLVFFTDALTAIAITLLILPLVDSVPEGRDATGGVSEFLAHNTGQLAAFVLSFAVIARLWAVHHELFEHVKAYGRSLFLLNIGWAFTIVFLPLPTEIVSQFGTSSATLAMYIGTMAVSSLLLTTMALLIRHKPGLELADNPIEDARVFGSVVTTVLFLAALLIGVLLPAVNFYALLIMLLGWPATAIRERRIAARA